MEKRKGTDCSPPLHKANAKKNDREEGAAVLRPYKGTKWLDGRGFSQESGFADYR